MARKRSPTLRPYPVGSSSCSSVCTSPSRTDSPETTAPMTLPHVVVNWTDRAGTERGEQGGDGDRRRLGPQNGWSSGHGRQAHSPLVSGPAAFGADEHGRVRERQRGAVGVGQRGTRQRGNRR